MKKRYKILIIIGSLLIILAVIAQFYANTVIQKLVRQEINTIKTEQQDNFFIEVEEIRVQLFLRRFILSGVTVNSIDSIPLERDNAFKINLNRLIVKLDGFTDVLVNGKLKLREIELDSPTIDFTFKLKNDSLPKQENKAIKSNRVKQIELSSFGINDGIFYLKKSTDSDVKLVSSVSGLDFKMDDVLLALNEESIDRKLRFEKILLDLGHVVYHDSKSHDLSANNLRYSNQGKGVFIEELSFRNKVIKDSIKNDFENKNAWVESRVEDLNVIIDFKLLKKKEIYIQNLSMNKLDLDLFQNKKEKAGFDLKEILVNISLPLSIDTLNIKKGTIDISIAKKNGNEDDFALNKLNINLLHISNDSLYIQNYSTIKGDVKSNIWRKGTLEAKFNYNVLQSRSDVKISLNNIPERKLIKYAREEKLAHIRSGHLNKLEIDYSSDSIHFEGKLIADISKLDLDYTKFPKNSSIKSIRGSIKELGLNSSFYKKDKEELNLLIESALIYSPKIIITEKENIFIQEEVKSLNSKNKLKGILSIDLLSIKDASIKYKKEGSDQDILAIEEVNVLEKSLVLNLSKKGSEMIVSSGNYKVDLSSGEFFQAPHTYLTFKSAGIEKTKNKIDIIGLRFKNKTSKNTFHSSSKEGNTWNSAYIEQILINADLERLLKNELYCNNVKIVRPIITYIKATDRIEEKELIIKKNKFTYPISVESLDIIDADIDFRVKTKNVKEFEIFDLSNFNGVVQNIKFNSINKYESQVLSASFHSDFYTKGKIDINIEHDLSTTKSISHIEAKARHISMNTLKEKVSVFKKIDYLNGELSELNVEIDISNKNVNGKVELDSLNLEKLMLGSDKDSDWLSFKFDQLISHFSFNEKNGYSASSLKLKKPVVDIHHVLSKKTESTSEMDRSPIFVESGVFKELATLDRIEIDNGIIKQFKGDDTKSPITTIRNINIRGDNVAIYDSTNTVIPISIKGLDIKMNNIIVHSFPLFDMTIESSNLNIGSKKVTLRNIELKNKKSPKEFYKDLTYRKAWMDLVVPKVEIDIRFKDFFSTHPRISKAIITDVNFTTIVNVGLDVSPEEKPLPNRVLANSIFPITVDSILVKDSQINVKFKDYNENSKHGILQFNDVNASVANLTTDKDRVKENNEMIWDFHSTLWETGETHAIVNYKLDSENDDFSMYGSVNNMNMVNSDTLTSHLYGIAVNDGTLNHAYFEINGNNDEASGFVRFDYEDLKVSLEKKKKNLKDPDELKKVKKKDKLNQSFVKSMVVNGLIRKKNLPEDSKYMPQGNAFYKREKNKPIFALMWFTISSGIIEIAEAPIVSTITNFGKIFKKKDKEEENKEGK